MIFVWLPTLLIWVFNFRFLWRYKKTLIYVMFFATMISTLWDIHAIQNNIWFFPRGGHLGIYIYTIPIEEFLFMATVTLMVSSITIIAKYKLSSDVKI